MRDTGEEHRGRLVLVVGPSGAGKDTLLAAARTRLAGVRGLSFAERVVTRPNRTGLETHLQMDALEFEMRREEGHFGLHWGAHGNHYGVPIACFEQLAAGETLVVNASRSVVPYARERFPPVTVILVTAPVAVRRARLAARGRESAAEIEARLERSATFDADGVEVHELVNDGDLTTGAERFAALLSRTRDSPRR